MLIELCDFLETLNLAENYYIGKIDNSKLKTVGIYPLAAMRRVEAVGKESSYDVAGFRLLVHWNKNARQTEDAARNVFEKLRYINSLDMGNIHVDYIDLTDGEPVFLGTDENGVYEYHIAGNIYYRR